MSGGAPAGFWQGGLVEREGAAAGRGETREIGAKTVAEVHHRAGTVMRGEPLGLGHARRESEVLPAQRSAEAPGDIERISGFSSAAPDAARAGDFAGERDIQKEGAGRSRSLAAHNGDTEMPRGPAQPAVKAFDPSHRSLARRSEGDERMPWRAPHGGDVADCPTERFPSDPAWIGVGQEMDILDYAIDLEQMPARRAGCADDGAIVAGTGEHIGASGQAAEEPGEQGIFAKLGEGHEPDGPAADSAIFGPHVSKASCTALKTACIEIGTSSEPLHS